MTRTTSPQKAPPKTRELRSFEDAMYAQTRKALRGGAGAQTLSLTLLALGAGAAALLGLLPHPYDTAVPLALAGLVAVDALIGFFAAWYKAPLRRVRWATYNDYEEQLLESVSPAVRKHLTNAQHRVRSRIPTLGHTYLYVMHPDREHSQICSIESGGCSCALLSLGAALRPNRSRAVLVVGELLLGEVDQLEFVLAHETYHARPLSRTLHLLLGMPLLEAWLVLGLAVPLRQLAVVAPVLWLATSAARWADELRADIAAARAVGARAAGGYWARVRGARRRPAGARRVLAVAAAVVAAHPPIALRVAVAERAGRSAR